METQAVERPSTLTEFLEGKLIPITGDLAVKGFQCRVADLFT